MCAEKQRVNGKFAISNYFGKDNYRLNSEDVLQFTPNKSSSQALLFLEQGRRRQVSLGRQVHPQQVPATTVNPMSEADEGGPSDIKHRRVQRQGPRVS